jgi:hypothetical protein
MSSPLNGRRKHSVVHNTIKSRKPRESPLSSWLQYRGQSWAGSRSPRCSTGAGPQHLPGHQMAVYLLLPTMLLPHPTPQMGLAREHLCRCLLSPQVGPHLPALPTLSRLCLRVTPLPFSSSWNSFSSDSGGMRGPGGPWGPGGPGGPGRPSWKRSLAVRTFEEAARGILSAGSCYQEAGRKLKSQVKLP